MIKSCLRVPESRFLSVRSSGGYHATKTKKIIQITRSQKLTIKINQKLIQIINQRAKLIKKKLVKMIKIMKINL